MAGFSTTAEPSAYQLATDAPRGHVLHDLLEARALPKDALVMPAQREWSPWVEFVETVPREAGKIGAQQCLVLAQAMRFGRRHASRRVQSKSSS
jgi:hypothetical protein